MVNNAHNEKKTKQELVELLKKKPKICPALCDREIVDCKPKWMIQDTGVLSEGNKNF